MSQNSNETLRVSKSSQPKIALKIVDLNLETYQMELAGHFLSRTWTAGGRSES